MPQIICESCGTPFEVTEKEAEWKTMCKRCFARMKQAESERKDKFGDNQKPVSEFRSGNQIQKPSIKDDVGLIVNIAKQLASDLDKNVNELSDSERAWVSTIYIQRKRL